MTTYIDKTSVSPRSLAAWDGTQPWQEHCGGPGPNKSENALQGSLISGIERSIVPFSDLKFSKAKNDTTAWSKLFGKVVVMTPLTKGRVTTQNFTVSVPRKTELYRRLCGKYKSVWNGASCTLTCENKAAQETYNSWNDVYDLGKCQEFGFPTYTFSDLLYGDVLAAVGQAQMEASNNSFRDYDALTDAFQAKGMLGEFSSASKSAGDAYRKLFNGFSKSDIRGASRLAPRSLLKSTSKAFRKIGAAWLAYRYTLGTSIMSFNDIKKAVSSTWLLNDRARRIIHPRTYSFESLPQTYIKREVTGEVIVRSQVTCIYSSNTMAMMAKIGVNPLSTAWELIPYSFVLDWFIGVGDYITQQFSASFADHCGACSSIRTRIVESFRMISNFTDTLSANWVGNGTSMTTCWPTLPPHPNLTFNVGVNGLLRNVITDSYERTLFSRVGNMRPILDPSINWKRTLDGFALSFNQLRRFKNWF